jgi:uroporphyrinogen decarboxylase
MTSRERVLTALSHKTPDRVPVDYWATPEVTELLLKHFGLAARDQLLDHLDADLRVIPGPAYIGPPFARHADGAEEDIWGVPRIEKSYGDSNRRGVYKEVTVPPLVGATSVRDVLNYPKWPRPEWFDYSEVARQCKQYPGRAIVFVGDRLNRTSLLKAAMYLRGTAEILGDLVESPAMAEAIFAKVAEFYLEYNKRVFEAADGGIDIFMSGDDFGTQSGLFVRHEMWKRFFAPGLRRYWALARKYGVKVMHHSCGSIKPLIPDMIEMGLDVLNPIQPGVADMDPRDLKARFGARLSFHGSIDIQKTLPFGTPADVRAEVRDRMQALAPGGGFIICTAHNIQLDTPLENILALFDAYREFGARCLAL